MIMLFWRKEKENSKEDAFTQTLITHRESLAKVGEKAKELAETLEKKNRERIQRNMDRELSAAIKHIDD